MSVAPDRILGGEPPAWDHLPSGPMSLLDMMNFSLDGFVWALKSLSQEIAWAVKKAVADTNAQLSEPDKERVTNNLKFIAEICNRMLLGNADNRLGRIFTDLRTRTVTYTELANEFNVLREAIEDDIKYERFFHYPHQKGLILLCLPGDWADTFKAFPSARYDIEQAVDCYACEHNTAAVFHLMRVAEHGLRALARERNVRLPRGRKIEWEDWNGVMAGISKKVDLIGGKPRGPARDAALEFYRGALGEFAAFKDAYRNNVMHARKSYDEHEALGVLTHVRSFMERLSSKIDESAKKRIKWGIR